MVGDPSRTDYTSEGPGLRRLFTSKGVTLLLEHIEPVLALAELGYQHSLTATSDDLRAINTVRREVEAVKNAR